jgi:uncharacterized protein YicC (UPF0701 family)
MNLDAMKQALAVLEEIADEVASPYDNKLGDAILALRAAIEQAETPEKRREQVDPIWVRIMCEAYDLADRGDSEGYNAVKVMCSDVLAMIKELIAAEREACAKVCEQAGIDGYGTLAAAAMIRARGER